MKKLLLLLTILLITTQCFAFYVEEKVNDRVMCDYTVDSLEDIKQPLDRDVYVDGELYVNEEWSDFEIKFDKLLKSFALVVLSEINILRVNSGLSERTVSQLKQAVKNKYNTLN